MVEYFIVRCCNCSKFQVQQRKKVNKFKCTVCGKAQSVRKLYGESYKASDLRPIVQDYNMKEGLIQETKKEQAKQQESDESEEVFYSDEEPAPKQPVRNQWEQFAWSEQTFEEYDESCLKDDPKFTLGDEPKLTKRKRQPRNKQDNSEPPKKRTPKSNNKSNPSTNRYPIEEDSFDEPIAPRRPNATTTNRQKTPIVPPKTQKPTPPVVAAPKAPANSMWSKFSYTNSDDEFEED
jgi:predicted RNA-binding Zn-ribbon protein involved in translation (DUF1610 family)